MNFAEYVKIIRYYISIFYSAWSLRAIFNINGHAAFDEFNAFGKDAMTFGDVASEIYGHRFDVGNDPEAEIFDPTSSQHFDYNRLYNRDQARFLAADLNGDQTLSKTEWVLFQNPLKVTLKSRQRNH